MVAMSEILKRITGVQHTFDGPYLVCAEPDGDQYIARWDESVLGPRPTDEQIAAVGNTIDVEIKAADIRNKRNQLIAETDYLVMPDYPITEERKQKVLTYRQELRDITEQEEFPQSVVWPVLED